MKHRRIDPSYFNLFIALSPMMHLILPIRIVIYPPFTYLRLVAVFAGVVLNVSAVGHLRRKFTSVTFGENSRVMASDGPYRFIRHPTYVAFPLVTVALFLLSANWLLGLVGFFLSVTISLSRAPIEERELLERFGDRYRRMLPTLASSFLGCPGIYDGRSAWIWSLRNHSIIGQTIGFQELVND